MTQMVFITRFWKKAGNHRPPASRISTRFLSGLVFLCMTSAAVASDISIAFATSAKVQDNYVVNAYITYEFDDEVLTALAHGIPLTIEIHIKIKRQRNWLWDPVVRDETINYKLQRHALSEHYLLTNLNDGSREQFQYLDEVLRTLGSLNDHFLFDESTVHPKASYIGFIKSELDIESLPPPLRIIAYFSPHWHADSGWYEWLVK